MSNYIGEFIVAAAVEKLKVAFIGMAAILVIFGMVFIVYVSGNNLETRQCHRALLSFDKCESSQSCRMTPADYSRQVQCETWLKDHP